MIKQLSHLQLSGLVFAGMLALCAHSAHAAEMVRFGPDGTLVVVSQTRPEVRPFRFEIQLFTQKCLADAKPLSCAWHFEITGQAPAHLSWREDGRALFVQSGASWLRLHDRGDRWVVRDRGKITAHLPSLPSYLSTDVFERLPAIRSVDRPPGDEAYPLLNSAGRMAAWEIFDLAGRGFLQVPTGQRITPPPHVFDADPLGQLQRPIDARVVGTDGDLQLWSENLGRWGQLSTLGPDGVRVREPSGVGPWTLVEGPGGGAVGFHSLDQVVEFRPMGGVRLGRALKAARKSNRALELRSAAVGPGGEAAMVLESPDLERKVLYCTERSKPCRVIDGAAAPDAVIREAEAVVLPGDVPARIYRTRLRERRGVAIYFQGGPGMRLDGIDHGPTRVLAKAGYDVLAVGYRGSSGYGEAWYLAPYGRVVESLQSDLDSALRWAKRQPGMVGFYGSSFGGAAGVAAAIRPNPGLDFIVLDSPLIEPRSNCQIPRAMRLFGAVQQSPEICRYPSLNLFPDAEVSATPVVLFIGAKDAATPQIWSVPWRDAVRRKGGCVTTLVDPDGGHGVASWSEPMRKRAEERLSAWLRRLPSDRSCDGGMSLAPPPD
jgi:dienelactone hydrolase